MSSLKKGKSLIETKYITNEASEFGNEVGEKMDGNKPHVI